MIKFRKISTSSDQILNLPGINTSYSSVRYVPAPMADGNIMTALELILRSRRQHTRYISVPRGIHTWYFYFREEKKQAQKIGSRHAEVSAERTLSQHVRNLSILVAWAGIPYFVLTTWC